MDTQIRSSEVVGDGKVAGRSRRASLTTMELVRRR